jgi:hypothetical protein
MAGSAPGRLLRHAVAHRDGQDVTDGWFLAGRFWQREVRLDLIAVAAAVFVLDDVSGRGQVRDDAVRAALGDTHGGGDVPQPRTRILRDAQQHPGVIGQEAPSLHPQESTTNISRNILLVFEFGCKFSEDTGKYRPSAARFPGHQREPAWAAPVTRLLFVRNATP